MKKYITFFALCGRLTKLINCTHLAAVSHDKHFIPPLQTICRTVGQEMCIRWAGQRVDLKKHNSTLGKKETDTKIQNCITKHELLDYLAERANLFQSEVLRNTKRNYGKHMNVPYKFCLLIQDWVALLYSRWLLARSTFCPWMRRHYLCVFI